MERTEHTQIIQNLMGMLTPEQQASGSELLTQLSEDYEATLTTLETANTNVTQLTERNERLREVNADLFLKVGTKGDNKGGKETPLTRKENPSLTYEALFNEKGELI